MPGNAGTCHHAHVRDLTVRVMQAQCACKIPMRPYHAGMNSKHRSTLAAVFADPVSGAIAWDAIEALLVSAGCAVAEGSGSRVRFVKDGIVASFHRPHPAKEAKRYQVRDARDYLIKLGLSP